MAQVKAAAVLSADKVVGKAVRGIEAAAEATAVAGRGSVADRVVAGARPEWAVDRGAAAVGLGWAVRPEAVVADRG